MIDLKSFSFHARHAIFYLYDCRFSNSYLQNFVTYGIDLDENSTETVSLLKSRPYNIFKTSDRVDCFKLIAYLIFYLNSGEAEIRYLKNDATNPLWRVALSHFVDDCRVFLEKGSSMINMTLVSTLEQP